MNQGGRRYIPMRGLPGVVAMLAALSVLCTCIDDELSTGSEDTDTDAIGINFSIADYDVTTYTRALSESDMEAYAEPWSESPWLETTLSRLDFLVFKKSDDGYALAYHFYNASPSTDSEWKLTYTNNDSHTANYSYNIIDDTDSLYLIANYDLNVSNTNLAQDVTNDTLKTLAQLKAILVRYGDNETPHGARTNFYYSARLAGSDYTADGEKHTYTFALQRHMAKACIRIYYKGLDKTSYTQLDTFTKKNINLQAIQYTVAGRLTDDGVYPTSYTCSLSGTTSIETGWKTKDSIATTTYNTYTYTYTRNIDVESEEEGAEEETYYTDDNAGSAAVFYFYPNDWLNMNAVSNIKNEQPIFSDYRTYIQMNIKFTAYTNHTGIYEYEIPLNYLLPTDNDSQTYAAVEEAHTDTTYKDLYRIYANRIYNVNVYIQEQETGLVVGFNTGSVITDLDEGGTIDIDEDDITFIVASSEEEDDSDDIVEDADEGGSITTYYDIDDEEEESDDDDSSSGDDDSSGDGGSTGGTDTEEQVEIRTVAVQTEGPRKVYYLGRYTTSEGGSTGGDNTGGGTTGGENTTGGTTTGGAS